MGCASSKQVKAVDVYKPPPNSFAVFDINAIDEPWVMVEQSTNINQDEKTAQLPAIIRDKLNNLESDVVPHSWDEVSKALEDLKPAIKVETAAASPPKKPAAASSQAIVKHVPRKSSSFHTLEELDAKLTLKSEKTEKTELRKSQSVRNGGKTAAETATGSAAPRVVVEAVGFKPIKENIFLQKDMEERGKTGEIVRRRDPLSEYPEICPPGGGETVVVYMTSLRGVRRTYEDCSRVQGIFEVQGVVVDERDVALHGEYLSELRGLLGEEGGAAVPRVFLKGRYLGGAEEVVEMNEVGRLGRLLRAVGIEKGVGRVVCEGCGGARFVLCLVCGGSCKVVGDGGGRERCGKCNENGLVRCPAC